MKKSIVALAVTSAAFASISAHAADDATVSFYGDVALMYTNVSKTSNGLADDGTAFGFKGESKITDSTSAFFNVKYKGIDASQKGTLSSFRMDNAQVGVKGDFGKAQVGSFDSVYNDAVQDGFDLSESLSWNAGSTNSGANGDTIAYFSPSMNGVSVAASVQKAGSGNHSTAVTGSSFAGRVSYTTDMFYVAVGTDQNKNSAATNTKSTSGVKVAYMGLPNMTLAAKYEKTQDTASYTAVNVSYNYGMGTAFTAYQRIKPQSGSSATQTELGVNYSLNSSAYVFAEVGTSDYDSSSNKKLGSATTTTNVGVVYSF